MRLLSPAARLAASLALCLALFAGCDSGSEPDDGDDLVNGITLREIRNGYIPSYPEVGGAFETILADDPTLTEDEDEMRLARALFDEVNRAGNAKQADLPDLTTEEWIVVLRDPLLSAIAYPAADIAKRTAQDTYPCGATTQPAAFNGDKADALRHSYWSALTVAYLERALIPEFVAVRYAERLTTAHESESDDGTDLGARLREMDFSNNAAGIRLAKDNGGASNSELLALLLAVQLEYVEGPIALNASRLVYFIGRDDYDVTLTGSFTNPDSNGGPWDATLTLTGCNQTLDGGLEIRRGDGSFQRRRVGGNIVEDGVQLAFSLPFEFENPNANLACRNLQAELTGSPTALSGPWTSTNCEKGGQFSLSQ